MEDQIAFLKIRHRDLSIPHVRAAATPLML